MTTSKSKKPFVANHPVAVFGGNGRLQKGLVEATKVVTYKSSGHGGNGDARSLETALRAGSFGTLIILTRQNGHTPVGKLKALCKRLGVDVVFV